MVKEVCKCAFTLFRNPESLGKELLEELSREQRDRPYIQWLIQHGASLEEKDSSACTPLAIAALRGETAIVKSLLDKGAEIESKDRCNCTALMHAALKGDVETVRLLLERGANANAPSISNATPLFKAIWSGSLEAVELLLKHGADANWEDQDGNTPLMIVAFADQNPDLIDLLVKHGALIDQQNPTSGETALIYATMLHAPAVARRLILQGADENLKSADGRVALDYARAFASTEVADVIHEALQQREEARLHRKQGLPLKKSIKIGKPLALKTRPAI